MDEHAGQDEAVLAAKAEDDDGPQEAPDEEMEDAAEVTTAAPSAGYVENSVADLPVV